MMRIAAVLLLVAGMAASTLTHAAQPSGGDWQYTVRPGDNLWVLAHRFCGSYGKADELARHNQLASPEHLVAGQRLSVPTDCLVRQPASAGILSAGGGAVVVRDGNTLTARRDMEIRMGDVVRTAGNFVVVGFADGSRLTIRPNSTVTFVLVSAYGETGMVDTLVRVGRGRVQHVVDNSVAGSRHRIATPVGVAAVRGTRYRVSLLEGGSAALATTQGLVTYSDVNQQTTDVEAGTGLIASNSGTSKEALLPAPTWATASRVGSGGDLAWQSVPGARAYRVTLFQRGAPIAEEVVAQNSYRLATPVGEYQVALRAIAVSGLEGLEARESIEVVDAPSALSHDVQAEGQVALRWQGAERATVEIWRLADPQNRRVLEGCASGTTVELPPGQYAWRVADDAQAAWSEAGRFEVLPPAVGNLVAVRESIREPLLVSWAHESEGATYRIRVLRGSEGTLVSEQTVSALEASVAAPFCRPCTVEVSAEVDELQSAVTSVAYEDPPGKPWPLYALLMAALMALL